jgi:hypothetical protein
MTDLDRLRRRLADVGADVPPELIGLIASLAGPLLTAHEQLAALDLGDAEPFCPARRLPDDAVT